MRAYFVQGLFYGDEGKGKTVDILTRRHKARINVRFNGGCQAAHNVISERGIHHTFSQFGSGTMSGADTFLSEFMLVEPYALAKEQGVLRSKGFDPTVYLDPQAVITTPLHKWANRIREIGRGAHAHGSVGLGIGETRQCQLLGTALRVADLAYPKRAEKLLKVLKSYFIEDLKPCLVPDNQCLYDLIEKYNCAAQVIDYDVLLHDDKIKVVGPGILSMTSDVVFEGAQGVLLDETHGFHPHNTWTDCTFGNAMKIVDHLKCPVDIHRVGVMRTYMTRHGVGPFCTEGPLHGGVYESPIKELHNTGHPYMGKFRTGQLDLVALQYSLQVLGGVDEIAMHHLDRYLPTTICEAYRVSSANSDTYFTRLTQDLVRQEPGSVIRRSLSPVYRQCQDFEDIVQLVEDQAQCKVGIRGIGPRTHQIVLLAQSTTC